MSDESCSSGSQSSDPNVDILHLQGWKETRPGYWRPPTGHTEIETEKALEVANDNGFKEILAIFNGL